MPASYPNTIKTFTAHRDYLDDVDAVDVNEIQDEVVAMQKIIGVNPLAMVDRDPGQPVTWNTIAGRLDALEGGKTTPIFKTSDNVAWTLPAGSNINTVRAWNLPAPPPGNDTLGWYIPSGFKVNRTGWYNINVSAMWKENAAEGTRRTCLALGSGENVVLAAVDESTGKVTNRQWAYHNAGAILLLGKGTILRLAVAHNCPTAQAVQYGRLEGVFLRDV